MPIQAVTTWDSAEMIASAMPSTREAGRRLPAARRRAGLAIREALRDAQLSDTSLASYCEVREGAASRGLTRSDGATSRAKQKVAPWSALLVARKRPPWASTIERQIASPSPSPCSLVV